MEFLVCNKGIGIYANSTLTYNINGKWDIFSAILSADLNPYIDLQKKNYKAGKIQFGIYGDSLELFVSQVIDVNSKPQKVNIAISGIDELKLVVKTQDWLPYFVQCGNWINAKLERK